MMRIYCETIYKAPTPRNCIDKTYLTSNSKPYIYTNPHMREWETCLISRTTFYCYARFRRRRRPSPVV